MGRWANDNCAERVTVTDKTLYEDEKNKSKANNNVCKTTSLTKI